MVLVLEGGDESPKGSGEGSLGSRGYREGTEGTRSTGSSSHSRREGVEEVEDESLESPRPTAPEKRFDTAPVRKGLDLFRSIRSSSLRDLSSSLTRCVASPVSGVVDAAETLVPPEGAALPGRSGARGGTAQSQESAGRGRERHQDPGQAVGQARHLGLPCRCIIDPPKRSGAGHGLSPL